MSVGKIFVFFAEFNMQSVFTGLKGIRLGVEHDNVSKEKYRNRITICFRRLRQQQAGNIIKSNKCKGCEARRSN